MRWRRPGRRPPVEDPRVGGPLRHLVPTSFLLAAALVGLGCSDGGDTAPEVQSAGVVREPTTTTVADPTGPDGPFAVGVLSEVFTDASRPTAENNDAPALPSRRLPTAIYYPAEGEAVPTESTDAPPLTDEGPYPLVIFSHGFTGTGPAYGVVLRNWAAAGYVVAAPTFPLSAGGSAGGPKLTDYVSQPADVRFVLDRVLGLSDGGDHPLSGMVDSERVAAAGHSLGGATTIGLGFNSCCADPLIDAYIPISGIELPFPDGTFEYEDRSSPVLLIHGSADTTLSLDFSKAVFAKATGPKFLVTLVNAGHTPFFDTTVGGVINDSVIDFLDRYLKDRADGLDRLGEHSMVDGLATLETAPPAS